MKQQEIKTNKEVKFNYKRFFPELPNPHPAIIRVYEYLKAENSKKDFLSGFVNIAGYPRWDKAIFKEAPNNQSNGTITGKVHEANDTICIVPLVTENNTAISGVLVAEILNGQASCRYSLLNNYNEMGEYSRKFVLKMIQFENFVFGYTTFKIYDSVLLGNARTIVLKNGRIGSSQAKSLTTKTQDDPCDIIEIWHDPTEEDCHCSGDEYYTGQWYYAGDCYVSPEIPILLPTGAGWVYSLPNTGPGGGGSAGSGNPPYSSTFSERLNYLLNNLDLSPESSDFLPTSQETVNELYHYLYNSSSSIRIEVASQYAQRIAIDFDYASFVESYRLYRLLYSGSSTSLWWQDNGFLSASGGIGFGSWAIGYLTQNHDLSFSIFQNWFFKLPEYTGGESSIDPDQISYDQPLQQVNLPSLSSFQSSFPKLGSPGNYLQMPSPDVYQLVGGSLYQSHLNNPAQYSNACAVRGSRALLYAGIDIPVLRYGTSGQRTQKGTDNKNYILDAVSFNKFMKDKFGETPYKLEGADANNPQKVADLLRNKNGIYVIVNNDSRSTTVGGAGYSGHVDLILNGSCIGGAYTTPPGGVKSIRIWVLN